jgi:hypothetical protein
MTEPCLTEHGREPAPALPRAARFAGRRTRR